LAYRTCFPCTFIDKINSVLGFKAEFALKDVMPVFHKYCDIPYNLRGAVEKHIRNVVDDGWLLPVTHSEWASPVWPILKMMIQSGL
jgi:hypothetical protein